MVARISSGPTVNVVVHSGSQLAERMPALREYATRGETVSLSRDPAWLNVFAEGFGHTPYALEAIDNGRTVGYLPLTFVRSVLFGRFLVSLPYLNSGGVVADCPHSAQLLIDQAVSLADDLRVKHLELRHEAPISHLAFGSEMRSKVHMRLMLPDSAAALQKSIGAKVRNQVRKGEKSGLGIEWGGSELIEPFHKVFSTNMRDLGTPVYGKKLITAIVKNFPQNAEICVIRSGTLPVAAALLLHGHGVTEVPSASTLREFNPTCANMLLYWNLLQRAIERKQRVFDFGRSTMDGNTFRFKKQWGAEPEPAVWQYYVRKGSPGEMRPDHPQYQRMIRIWQKLPVQLTRWIGPPIARGIP